MKRKAPASPAIPHRPAAAPPAEAVARPAAVDAVVRAILRRPNTVDDHLRVVIGPVGAGKTWLIRAAIAHPPIQRAFRDGVFWVDMGPRPMDLPRQLARIGKALGDPRGEEYASRESALERIAAVLTRKSALLVFDDVWDLHQALELRGLRHAGRTLVVSRNAQIADGLPEACMPVPPFSLSEAEGLLAFKAGRHDPLYADIAAQLMHNPMALAIAGAILQKGMRPGDWLDTFAQRTAREPGDLEARIRACCTINLMYVPAERRDLFFALGLFQPRVALPEAAIERAWQVIDASLTPYDRRVVFDDLQSYALIERRPDPHTVVVQDVLVQLAREALDHRLPGLHERFLASYNTRRRPWHEVKDDGYIYRFLGHHLHEALQHDTLRSLLLDFDWIQAALRATDMPTVQDDYALLHEDKTLRLVQEALWLSARALTRDPDQLSIQLIARLHRFDIVAIERFVHQIRRRIDRSKTWLEPRKSSLTTPGSALLQTLNGHLDVVRSIAFTPDGRFAVSGSEDATVKVWDLAAGVPVLTMYGHEAGVQIVAVSPDKPIAYSASDDGTIRLWDIDTGDVRRILRHTTGRILSLALLPDGRRALSAGEDGFIYLWDAHTGELYHTIDAGKRPIWAMAVTPDGRRMVAASDNRALTLWNLETGAIERRFPGHTDWVWDVAITPDGAHLVSASEDRTVIVWDFATGRIVRVLKGHQGAVRAVAVSADGLTAVTASEDQSLKVWDLQTGAIVRTFTGHDDWVWDVALAPDGLTALSASDDHAIKRWSLSSQYRHPDQDTHHKSVRAVRVSPDYIHAATVSDDQTLRLWRLSDGQLVDILIGHRDWIWDAAFAPSGRYAVTASFDGTLRIWNLLTGRTEFLLEGHTDWVWAVQMAPDGRHLVSGSEDGTVAIWRMEDGQRAHTLAGHEGGVTAVQISQDSRHVVSASMDQTVRIWSMDDGRLLHILQGHRGAVRSLHIADISQHVLSGSDDGTIRTWSLHAGLPEMRMNGHRQSVRHLLSLPMGFQLLSASEDRTIRLWDLASGQEEHRFAGHTAEIRDLAASADGRFMASVADDHAAFVWDLETRQRVAAFYADFPLTSCRFSLDGALLILGDAGGGVHMLEISE